MFGCVSEDDVDIDAGAEDVMFGCVSEDDVDVDAGAQDIMFWCAREGLTMPCFSHD